MHRFLALAIAVCFAGSANSALAAPSFTTIDNLTDPTFNQALAINNNGVVFGYFGSGQKGHPNQAYATTPPYTTFTPANVIGSVQTQVTTFKGALFGGFWSGANNGIGQDPNYGFVRMKLASGQFQTFLINGIVSGAPAIAQVLGVNALQLAVGFFNDKNNNARGFIYTIPTAQYELITIPGAVQTTAASINDNNVVAGFFVDGKGVTRAFLRHAGALTIFTVPGATVTQFLGVNNNGAVVGFYQLPGGNPQGLTYLNGQWKTLNVPAGVGGTTLNGLNDKRQIVGFYQDAAGNTHGVLVNNGF